MHHAVIESLSVVPKTQAITRKFNHFRKRCNGLMNNEE